MSIRSAQRNRHTKRHRKINTPTRSTATTYSLPSVTLYEREREPEPTVSESLLHIGSVLAYIMALLAICVWVFTSAILAICGVLMILICLIAILKPDVVQEGTFLDSEGAPFSYLLGSIYMIATIFFALKYVLKRYV